MNRFSALENSLVDSKKKTPIKYNHKENCFETENDTKFKIINGIPDFFVQEDNKLSLIQSDFYNKVKFPNYDEIDDFGSLLDKSQKSIFFRKLDEEIPMNSKVLEAGC